VVVQAAPHVVWVRWLGIRDIGTVDLQLDLARGETVTTAIVLRDVLDWVVVVHLLDGGDGRDRLLCLGDHHVLWERRQSGAFIRVQVYVLRVDFVIRVNWGVPRDTQFHIVVLECDQWDRGLPVFTERESEWVERTVRVVRNWRLRVVLGHRDWCDVLREHRRLFIDDLATNQELDLLDARGPRAFAVSIWVTARDVAVSEQVTLAFETNGGDAVRGWSALKHLALHSLGEVRVTTIVRSEETDFRLADEMGILGTDSDELGNTTRHFIYSEVIFLCGVIT